MKISRFTRFCSYPRIKKIRFIGLLILGLFLFQSAGFAQYSKKKKNKKSVEKYSHISGIVGFNFQTKTYIFLTKRPPLANSYNITQPSVSLFPFGVSYQSMNEQFLFQEFAIPYLMFNQRSEKRYVEFLLEDFTETVRGTRHITFRAALRYEVGKYFTSNAASAIKFGLAGSIEPSYLLHKQTPYTSLDFPTSLGRISLDAALVPRCSVRLGDKLSLIAKFIPSTRITSLFINRIVDPSLPIRTQRRTTFNETFDFNFAASLQISYLLKSPEQDKKKKKKRKRRR